VTDEVLVPHPGEPLQTAVRGLIARVALEPACVVVFEYRLKGDLGRLAVPRRVEPRRADRLWERTCFEAFVAPAASDRYYELNFSPSTEWAAYAFEGYRRGMQPCALAKVPSIAVVEETGELRVTAALEFRPFPDAPWPWRIGLTAVVEDRAGERSYYALRHPRQKPDFHDAAGFTVSLDGSAR
jgi:hypothetical protein